jgi:pimeloyl-ACP methyl ester carboxylesterase
MIFRRRCWCSDQSRTLRSSRVLAQLLFLLLMYHLMIIVVVVIIAVVAIVNYDNSNNSSSSFTIPILHNNPPPDSVRLVNAWIVRPLPSRGVVTTTTTNASKRKDRKMGITFTSASTSPASTSASTFHLSSHIDDTSHPIPTANTAAATTSAATTTNVDGVDVQDKNDATDTSNPELPTEAAAATTTTTASVLRGLYPAWETYENGTLIVAGRECIQHHLHYKICYGNKRKQKQVIHNNDNNNDSSERSTSHPQQPTTIEDSTTTTTTTTTTTSALFLHGGPGAGCTFNHARFFDPQRYDQVILLDQRGCGQSTPRVGGDSSSSSHQSILKDNTLLDIVHDCERLRVQLNISQWTVLLGGSWGSAVAITYGQIYPTRVSTILLRGVCTMRKIEIEYLFGSNGSAAQRYPDAYDAFYRGSCLGVTHNNTNNCNHNHNIDNNDADTSPPRRGRSAVKGYFEQFTTTDSSPTTAITTTTATDAAKSWFQWEMLMSVSHKLPWNMSEVSSDRTAIINAIQNWDNSVGSTTKKKTIEGPIDICDDDQEAVVVGRVQIPTNNNNHNNKSNKNDGLIDWTVEDAAGRTIPINNNKNVDDNDDVVTIERKVNSLRLNIHQQLIEEDGKYDNSSSDVFPTIPTLSKSTSTKTSQQGRSSNISPQVLLTCYYSLYRDYCMNFIPDLLDGTRMERLVLGIEVDDSSKAPSEMTVAAAAGDKGKTTKSPSTETTTQIPLTTATANITSEPIHGEGGGPTVIAIQGGMDRICPPDTALDLLQAWANAAAAAAVASKTNHDVGSSSTTSNRSKIGRMELRIPLRAGHSMYDPYLTNELVRATDRIVDTIL